MRYKVVTVAQAERDVQQIYDWLLERSSTGAVSWFSALSAALDSLEDSPQRCAYAPENESHPAPIRQLIFKTRRGRPYRLLFTIAGEEVRVLHVRGPGQRLVTDESSG